MWKRYFIVFLITSFIFILAFLLSSSFSGKKIEQLRGLEDQIALNILSSETKYNLLEKTSCSQIDYAISDIGLNSELTDLAKRIKFLESQLGSANPDVVSVKKYYSLLQIKDYLLTKEFHDRCGQNILSVLYFHGAECEDCADQSIILDEISRQYPEVRVYWIDRDVETPAVKTLVSMFDIEEVPSIAIDEKTHAGLLLLEEIKDLIPELKLIDKERAKEEAKKAKEAEASL